MCKRVTRLTEGSRRQVGETLAGDEDAREPIENAFLGQPVVHALFLDHDD